MRRKHPSTLWIGTLLVLAVALLLPVLHAHEHEQSSEREHCHACSVTKHEQATVTATVSPFDKSPVAPLPTAHPIAPSTSEALCSCAERAPPTHS